MVLSCSAFNCTERQKSGTDISFHGFPKDSSLQKKWIIAMRRENFKPSKSSKICSKHFTLDSFITSGWSSKKQLKNDAVPSLFDFPSHLVKQVKTRKLPAKRENVLDETAASQSENTKIVKITSESISVKNLVETPEESFLEPPLKKRRHYLGDFEEQKSAKVSNRDQHYKVVVNKLFQIKNKQIKMLQQRNRRLVKKVTTLKFLLEHLKEKQMIDEGSSLKLSDTMHAYSKAIFKQLMTSKRTKPYPAELKTFALTLNFYSPKAYLYVRKTFTNMLPHPRTLQKWYQVVTCEPGFQEESLKVLKQKVIELKEKGKSCICSLMVDEMSIHQKVEWDGEKFLGYVDIGSDLQSDFEVKAKEAIVFLINSLNDTWKLPIGYFLINGISGAQKCNLIKMCLKIMHEAGVTITSLTFDGAASNISMATHLGADLSIKSQKTYFVHPVTNQPIYVILDPPHMLKFIRNTFGTYKIMFDGNNEAIKWEYLEKLVGIQEKEGLHLATKITRRHINWFKEKMKVKLAAQTFSQKVSKALNYLRKKSDNYSKDFENSKATENFIQRINDIFDILNSRNLLAKNFKSSLQQHNKNAIFEKIEESIKYLITLKCSNNGELLCESQRKTGFIGMIISLKSYMGIWRSYVEGMDGGLKYLSAYKLSQDHLEVFFSSIRGHGGYNNNPTAKQFKAAYKRLLMHTSVTGSSQANCIEQAPSIILAMSTTNTVK